jgi:hypothetical protein
MATDLVKPDSQATVRAFDMITERLTEIEVKSDRLLASLAWSERRKYGPINSALFGYSFALERLQDATGPTQERWPSCVIMFEFYGGGDWLPIDYYKQCEEGAYEDIIPGLQAAEGNARRSADETKSYDMVESSAVGLNNTPHKYAVDFLVDAIAARHAPALGLKSARLLGETMWLDSESSWTIDEWVDAALKLLRHLGLEQAQVDEMSVCPTRRCTDVLYSLYAALGQAGNCQGNNTRGAAKGCLRALKKYDKEYVMNHPVLEHCKADLRKLCMEAGV